MSMRDRTHGRGGREGGGHDRGGRDGARFQDGENERNISMALLEYDADDAHNHFVDHTCGKFQESTDQPSWSTDKANPVSAAFMPLIDRQSMADGEEAAIEDAMAAKVDEVEDADAAMITEAGPQLWKRRLWKADGRL
jgi:hypothetical protein